MFLQVKKNYQESLFESKVISIIYQTNLEGQVFINDTHNQRTELTQIKTTMDNK